MPRRHRPFARRLLTGETAPEVFPIPRLSLDTRVPQKWLAVDLETGDVWRGTDEGGWARYGRALPKRVGAPYIVIKTGKE